MLSDSGRSCNVALAPSVLGEPFVAITWRRVVATHRRGDVLPIQSDSEGLKVDVCPNVRK